MTISDNYAPTKQQGDNVTVTYTAFWPVFNEDFLVVIFEDVATGVQTIQETGFIIVVEESQVSVTFDIAPTSAVYVILARNLPILQQVPYRTSRGFQGSATETSFDFLTAVVQDQQDQIDRSPKTPIGSDPFTFPPYIAGLNIGWSPTNSNELVNAEKTITEIDDAVNTVAGLVAGSGVLVSDNDTTIGFLQTKLLEGAGITLTVNNEGGNETITVTSSSQASETGDMIASWKASKSGWLIMDGSTIGDVSSGADQESASYEALFTHLWDTVDDAYAPVSGGRGASAAADWAALKTIEIPEMMGRGFVGTGTGTGLSKTWANGEPFGVEERAILESNLAAHTHASGSLGTDSAGAHTHTVATGSNDAGTGEAGRADSLAGSVPTNSNGAHTHNVSGTTGSVGSDTPLNVQNPDRATNWFIKI